jgi:hypothetical protein
VVKRGKKKVENLQNKEQSRQFTIFDTELEEKNFLFVLHIPNICKIAV